MLPVFEVIAAFEEVVLLWVRFVTSNNVLDMR